VSSVDADSQRQRERERLAGGRSDCTKTLESASIMTHTAAELRATRRRVITERTRAPQPIDNCSLALLRRLFLFWPLRCLRRRPELTGPIFPVPPGARYIDTTGA